MSRRAPQWLVEAVAWSASLVLVAGVAVAASGVIQHRAGRAGTLVETPVLITAPSTASPRPAPHGVKPVHAGSASVAQVVPPSFGPPPGAQHDLVPTAYAPPEQRWALLVGITHYRKPTHNTLAGANDVAFIRAYLINAGWRSDHIRVLTNEQATGAAMRADLGWLVGKSTPGTFTLFHYSGHVKQQGGHEFLWPYDHALIKDTDLAALVHRGTGKAWVDIAGCEAAGFIEDLPSDRVLVSTSSKANQKSYEHPYWHESIWVGLLWDAGMNQGQADADGNHVVTVGEGLRFAAYWAPVLTYTQRPHGRQSPQVAGMPVRGWTLADPPA